MYMGDRILQSPASNLTAGGAAMAETTLALCACHISSDFIHKVAYRPPITPPSSDETEE
jgi:hypothetical protein